MAVVMPPGDALQSTYPLAASYIVIRLSVLLETTTDAYWSISTLSYIYYSLVELLLRADIGGASSLNFFSHIFSSLGSFSRLSESDWPITIY